MPLTPDWQDRVRIGVDREEMQGAILRNITLVKSSVMFLKAIARAFSICGARENRILRKLGLHYTITHTYNAGQRTPTPPPS